MNERFNQSEGNEKVRGGVMEVEAAEGRFSQIKNKREICMKSSHLSEGGGGVLKISINVRNNHYKPNQTNNWPNLIKSGFRKRVPFRVYI